VRFIRAAAAQVIGLFVGEWTQTLLSIAILAVGWFVLSRVHIGGLSYVVAFALAAQLVYATTAEARRRPA
jgi:uncharacterized membrane protein YczE